MCDICHEREAVHEIDGWRVCADQRCKYLAWTATKEGPGKEKDEEVNDGQE